MDDRQEREERVWRAATLAILVVFVLLVAYNTVRADVGVVDPSATQAGPGVVGLAGGLVAVGAVAGLGGVVVRRHNGKR